jgi:hypothetical protein
MTLHPAYFEVRFRGPRPPQWPTSFAIVTAYQTTGESWPASRNEAENAALARHLAGGPGRIIGPLTGYSPASGHAEPGFAVELPLQEACRVGSRFRQDAIYWVEGDELYVTSCARPELVPVGRFSSRLDADPG